MAKGEYIFVCAGVRSSMAILPSVPDVSITHDSEQRKFSQYSLCPFVFAPNK
jgi:hypothetical protein